jgi:hypothetical protein
MSLKTSEMGSVYIRWPSRRQGSPTPCDGAVRTIFPPAPYPGGEGWGGGRSWYTLHHPSLTLPLKGRGPEDCVCETLTTGIS